MLKSRDAAVSPVIAVVLLVAIAVILSAILFSALGGIVSNNSAPAQAGVDSDPVTDEVYSVQVMDSGNADRLRVVSPLGTEYDAGSVGSRVEVLRVSNGDGVSVIGTSQDGGENVVYRQPVSGGIVADIIVAADGSGDYNTITAALAASAAGDTIVVKQDVYPESFSITNDGITLIAEDGTVVAPPSGTVGIDISGNDVTLKNIEVDATNVDTGIRSTAERTKLVAVTVTNASGSGVELGQREGQVLNSDIQNNNVGVTVTGESGSQIVAGSNLDSNTQYTIDNQDSSGNVTAPQNYWGADVDTYDEIDATTNGPVNPADPESSPTSSQLSTSEPDTTAYTSYTLTPDYTVSRISSYAGDPVTFNASPTVASNTPVASYEWRFGDGDAATGEEVTHTYTTAGTYLVELTVTDSNGNVETESQSINMDTPPTRLIDSFEDGNMSEYAVTQWDGNADAIVSVSNNYQVEGSQNLDISGGEGYVTAISMTGLEYYPEAGNVIRGSVQTPRRNQIDNAGVWIGVQNYTIGERTPDGYLIQQTDNGYSISKYESGTKVMEETSANSGWDYAEFVFVIDWQTNATATTIEATIQGGDGSGNGMGGYLRTFSLVDESANQYTSGGFGFFGGKANNPVNVQYDYWRYD